MREVLRYVCNQMLHGMYVTKGSMCTCSSTSNDLRDAEGATRKAAHNAGGAKVCMYVCMGIHTHAEGATRKAAHNAGGAKVCMYVCMYGHTHTC